MPPQESQEPNKIVTLDDIWKLYHLLKHAISEKPLQNADEEISHIFDNLRDGTMKQAVGIIYGKEEFDPFTTILMFLDGLRFWGFGNFVSFVRGITHD